MTLDIIFGFQAIIAAIMERILQHNVPRSAIRKSWNSKVIQISRFAKHLKEKLRGGTRQARVG